MRTRALALVAALLGVLLNAGCGKVVPGQPMALSELDADRSLIADYFRRSNAAAREGPAAQREFLASTQHPDVPERCDLGELTVLLEPAMSTLCPDQGWQPARSDAPPRGRIYVVAVIVTVHREQAAVGTQVGSMHLVVLDGTAYGFAPCPA